MRLERRLGCAPGDVWGLRLGDAGASQRLGQLAIRLILRLAEWVEQLRRSLLSPALPPKPTHRIPQRDRDFILYDPRPLGGIALFPSPDDHPPVIESTGLEEAGRGEYRGVGAEVHREHRVAAVVIDDQLPERSLAPLRGE